MTNTYDLPRIRRELIATLAKSLKKNSKFYREDYEKIVSAVNKKNRKELLEATGSWKAIGSVSEAEMRTNCQF